MREQKRSTVLKRVMKEIGRYRILLVISMILSAVNVVLQLYIPYLFGDAIDTLIGVGKVEFDILREYSLKIIPLIILAALVGWICYTINNRLTYKVVEDLRGKSIRHIEKLPLSYLDRHSTGDIVGRVITDCDQFSDGLLLGLTQLFTGVLRIVMTLVFMIQKSIGITILVVLMTPVTFLVAHFISSRSYRMFQKQATVRGDETSLINEMVGNQRVVQAFGYEKTASNRFRAVNEELQGYSEKALFYSSLTNPSTRAVNSVIYALVALVGTQMILGGTLTVGGLSVLLSYADQYMKPFNDITSVITEMQNALACAGRIFDLLDEPEEVEDFSKITEDRSSAFDQKGSYGEVHISEVSFSYDPEQSLIENFNLEVRPGMRIAIVGPTGCGKTTFINLLMRFYDTTGGTISVDGYNIQEIHRASLRSKYGMVLQETWLREGTVRENLTFGREDATEEEIINAAKETYSWDIIKRLPKGLDTIIHESDLSQGEKQLLCITRAMIAKPEMLILDEATSSIDTRTEVKIQSAFDKLMEGRTSFIVAHRLSTIRHADLILVMKDGKIIEQGNHKELILQGGFYKTLYESQFEIA